MSYQKRLNPIQIQKLCGNFFKKLKGLKIKSLSRSKFDFNARLTLDYLEDYIF